MIFWLKKIVLSDIGKNNIVANQSCAYLLIEVKFEGQYSLKARYSGTKFIINL